VIRAGTLREPTLEDVVAARDRIRPHLAPTPLRRTPALERLVGAEVWVKHENLLPTGAFKVRGGINLMTRLDAGVRARGVVAASTGNHGQSVAYAARLCGAPAIVFAPENANPVKRGCATSAPR
jgi:threonine dehydratase